MSDKISPILIVRLSIKSLIERPQKTGLLFLLLALFYGLEESFVGDIPPDPITWLIMGLPIIVLFAPVGIVILYHFLGNADGDSVVIPDGYAKKCFRYIAYSVGFEAVQGVVTALIPLVAMLALPLFEPAGEKAAKLMSGIVGIALLAPVIYQVLKRTLVFPGLVIDPQFSLEKSNQLMEGHVLRFVASYAMLVAPFVLLVFLLDFVGINADDVKVEGDIKITPLIVKTVLSSLMGLVVMSALCSWYNQLTEKRKESELATDFTPSSADLAADYGQCQD